MKSLISNGKIQPLLFDSSKIFPFWLNLMPFVYLFDYPELKDALLNLIGNVALFIPLGIVWPLVFPKLDTHWKVIAAGVGASLCIEILQLPFFARSSDIDDVILNSAGYLIGYGGLLVRKNKNYKKHEKLQSRASHVSCIVGSAVCCGKSVWRTKK